MKKFIAILMLACLLSLTACQSAGQSSVPSPTQNQSAAGTDSTEPAEPETDMLEEMVAKMTVEEKVGQMFFARCPDEDAAETAAKYHLGGYILFGRDFDGLTADEVRANIQSYQDASDIPMLIGTDEEGGTVVRVSSSLRDEPFMSPRDYYTNGGWEAVEGAEEEKADLLLSLGINVNLAPVCDVTGDPDLFMYERSFSGDADEVSEFVGKTVGIYRSKKLGSVLKHFPGYGDNSDTHTGITVDSRSYSEFLSNDFKPFDKTVEGGIDALLAGHVLHDRLTQNHTTLSGLLVRQIAPHDTRLHPLVGPFQMDGVELVAFKGPLPQPIGQTLFRISERVIRTIAPRHHDADDGDQQQNGAQRKPRRPETVDAIMREQEDVDRRRHDRQKQEQKRNRIHRLPLHSTAFHVKRWNRH